MESWINQTLNSNLMCDISFDFISSHTSSDRDCFLSFSIQKHVRRNKMEGYSCNRKAGRDLKSNVSGFIKDLYFERGDRWFFFICFLFWFCFHLVWCSTGTVRFGKNLNIVSYGLFWKWPQVLVAFEVFCSVWVIWVAWKKSNVCLCSNMWEKRAFRSSFVLIDRLCL